MKTIKRFYDYDLRQIVADYLDVRPSQITSVFTEEISGSGEDEHIDPVFYIEVDMSDE